ncbi:MAG: tRNA (cytidine(56)-2'-O)-methyltransferase [Candidatus Diapherotrites archaeon]
MGKEAVVFRYGHRSVRDYRVTSHCCLVARAFGAKKIIINGAQDESIENTVRGVSKRWGNGFSVEFEENWRNGLKKLKEGGYLIVHATMYGLPLQKVEKKLKNEKKICVVAGSQKVEREVYNLADMNVSVTQQPHSEIAAIAMLLDRFFTGKELGKKFAGAEQKIIPHAKGKKVEKIRPV